MDDRERALYSLRRYSYKRAPDNKPFRLASGKESYHFIDVKEVALRAFCIKELADLLLEKLVAMELELNTKFHSVAGVALGGCPLATAVSMHVPSKTTPDKIQRYWDALYVRKTAKDHGTSKLIEGPFSPGHRVVLLEDVATTGGSSLKAIEILKNAGLEVPLVIAVVDREEGAAAAFEAAGVRFVSLFTISEIANV